MDKKRGYRALSCILAFVICMPMFFSGKAYAVEIPDKNTAIAENYWTGKRNIRRRSNSSRARRYFFW